MRLLLSTVLLLASAVLSGCAVAPASAYRFDPTQPQAKRTVPMDQVVALNDRVAQLQIQRNDVRARIAAAPDTWSRLALYGELHRIGARLSPLERELSTIASSR
ncbi:hypothetical protein [Caenimonas aquaedulcis]|uniref:Uncharacterized protein n=1 Tax=Caenimonas aquaedulcis TaxID=2793270 RepID=A0A931H0Q5_9BURK|nr:hypothetical protein [Caenimonas aquaedulcis]MBG9386437.1 hypothetical protein [Caenimonas aquaedulcis]